jgi:hypothetical protein
MEQNGTFNRNTIVIYLVLAPALMIVLGFAAYGFMVRFGLADKPQRKGHDEDDLDAELRALVRQKYWWRIGLAVHTIFFAFLSAALWVDAPASTFTLFITAAWGAVVATHYLFGWFALYGERSIQRAVEQERANILLKVEDLISDDGEINEETLAEELAQRRRQHQRS